MQGEDDRAHLGVARGETRTGFARALVRPRCGSLVGLLGRPSPMLCNNDWSYREDGPTIVRYFLVPTRKVWGNCAGYKRYLIGTLREREFQPELVLHAINTSSISVLASLLAVFGSLARLRAAPPRCGRVLCVVMSEVPPTHPGGKRVRASPER